MRSIVTNLETGFCQKNRKDTDFMGKCKDTLDRRLCVAPMMEWTDRHCRYFLRQVAPDACLFTEMVTAEALIHGDLPKLM